MTLISLLSFLYIEIWGKEQLFFVLEYSGISVSGILHLFILEWSGMEEGLAAGNRGGNAAAVERE